MATLLRRGIQRLPWIQRHFVGSQKAVPFRGYYGDGQVEEAQYKKTTVNILNKDEEVMFIDAYSPAGFRLNNGMRVIGPCAVFPRSILSWNIKNVEDIHEDSLSLFTLLIPKIDILILGVGQDTSNVNPKVISYLRSKKISVEILNTAQACSTFNFLNSEKRYVAAGLIPPSYIEPSEDDFVAFQQNQNLYETEYDYDDGPSDEMLRGIPEEHKKILSKPIVPNFREKWEKEQLAKRKLMEELEKEEEEKEKK